MMPTPVSQMVEMGLATSVLAPLLVWRVGWLDRLALPGVWALPVFVAVHDGLVITMAVTPMGALARTSWHLLLVLGAVVFWLPVLGRRRRLPDPGRIVYLFLALPMLDLAGVYDVLAGDQAGGLAMIVAMLPAAFVAIGVAWQWMLVEERANPGRASG